MGPRRPAAQPAYRCRPAAVGWAADLRTLPPGEPPGAHRRVMWHQREPIHAVFYYAPEVFAEAATLGHAVDTRWPSYFAWRSAPLGAAGPGLVAAAFYSFSPAMVAQHVPAAWPGPPPRPGLEGRL